jgi:hypothetical protein
MSEHKVYNYLGIELASLSDIIDMIKKSKLTERYKLSELAINYFGLESNWTKKELIEELEQISTELDADGKEDSDIGNIRLELKDHFNLVKKEERLE